MVRTSRALQVFLVVSGLAVPRGEAAPLPDTGQQRCWDESGAELSCSGTGQDGEHQIGVDWPTPRFLRSGDGTVTDRLTGLVWLEDVGCLALSTVSWTAALAAAEGLAQGSCGLTDGSVAGDWRLPNVNELASLIDFGVPQPALTPGFPFLDAPLAILENYWTSTTLAGAPGFAWTISLGAGDSATSSKADLQRGWAVRSAQ
jgi:Protein of unknown function (DUF1566)